jgi:hypothetical protein
MKKICFLLFVVFIFFSLQTFCQGNSDFKIDVGGKSIVIPTPEKGFVEVGDTLRKMFEPLFSEQNVLKAVFLPNDIIRKVGIDAISDEKLKYIVVGVSKNYENTDFSEKDFVEIRKAFNSTIPSKLPEYAKNESQILSKLKDISEKQETGTPMVFGSALDIKDAYAFLIFNKVNAGNGLQNVLNGSLTMRLKNKIININIYSYQANKESLDWICNTIQVFSLFLFTSNEDLTPTANSSSNNFGQNTSGTPSNLFFEIINMFKKLITKTPITFICLIIILILYYFATRKLLPTYLNSKFNQSSIYLFFKKMHVAVGKHPFQKGILRLFELFCVIAIIVSILKLIGLPVPSDIF